MTTTKSERLDLRLTPDQKDAVSAAAALSGRSVSDFSVRVLTESARMTILRQRMPVIEAEPFAQFTEVLERPARPNAALAQLLTRESQFAN